MRKFLVSAVAAVSVLSIAAPAAAQWVPPVYNYQPYNYGYRFNGFNFARSMETRVQRLRNDIRNLEYRISREAHDWNGRPGHYGRGYGRGH